MTIIDGIFPIVSGRTALLTSGLSDFNGILIYSNVNVQSFDTATLSHITAAPGEGAGGTPQDVVAAIYLCCDKLLLTKECHF
jgi:hypothetical protein